MLLGFILIGCGLPAFAVTKGELDNRIRQLGAKFEALQAQPDKCVPAEVLRQARGIILLDRTKAGFLFAYQGGGGVAMVKDPVGNAWSPAAFLDANEASLGFQVGGEQNFFVILLMNTNATRLLSEPRFELGGEARGTGIDSTAGVEGKVATVEQPVLIYDDRKGLYGGVAIKGGALTPGEEANHVYYDQFVTMKDILFDKKVAPSVTATDLARKITEYSHRPPPALAGDR